MAVLEVPLSRPDAPLSMLEARALLKALADPVRLRVIESLGVSVWGVTSDQALAGVIGPLIEVPVLVALVYLSLWLRSQFFKQTREQAEVSHGLNIKVSLLYLHYCIS